MNEAEKNDLTKLINDVFEAVDASKVGPIFNRGVFNSFAGNAFLNVLLIEVSKIRESWKD